MKVSISGTHDGVDWPPVGGVVDLSDAEAEFMVGNGQAEPVAEAERAAVAPSEKATVKRAARKKPAAPKAE
jgi:hypothetical protein